MKNRILYKILRPFLVAYIWIRYRPVVIGRRNIPSSGCILVANHKNNLDFICIGLSTKRNIHFLAKSELFKGFLKVILNSCGMIPVNREIKDKSVVPKCIEYLNKNEIVGIFPEGTFNKTKNVISEFKIGAVKMAYESKKPIIPIMIGKYKRRMKIIIGRCFYVEDDNLAKYNKKLMDLLKTMIIINGE